MENELQQSIQDFVEYTKLFDFTDTRILLKSRHTLKVVHAMDQICEGMKIRGTMKYKAMLCALYHDIGRFEQLSKYDTFQDSKSIDHAALSEEIVRKQNYLSMLAKEDQEQVLTAIANHNRKEIEPGLDEETRFLCQMLRDADKLDIFRVFLEENASDVCEATLEEMKNMTITNKVMEEFLQGHTILKTDRRNGLDIWVSVLAFVFDLNFPISFQIANKQGYYKSCLNALCQIEYSNPETVGQCKQIEQFINAYIENKSHIS